MRQGLNVHRGPQVMLCNQGWQSRLVEGVGFEPT